MNSAVKALPAYRIVSAACAVVITSVIVLGVGLGFSSQAHAQEAPEQQESASLPLKADFVNGPASMERGRYLVG